MFRISSGFGEMEPPRRDRREGWGQGKIEERWKGSGSGGRGGGMATEGKEGSWVVGGQGEREREDRFRSTPLSSGQWEGSVRFARSSSHHNGCCVEMIMEHEMLDSQIRSETERERQRESARDLFPKTGDGE